jgi:hypothetical protein
MDYSFILCFTLAFTLRIYGFSFEHLPGKKNVVADALSGLDIDDLKI